MDARPPSERPHGLSTDNNGQISSLSEKKAGDVVVASSEASTGERDGSDRSSAIPLKMKLIAILLVTATGFGSHWSSGVTGAMKTTVKKVWAA
jgi:hypothetical protein